MYMWHLPSFYDLEPGFLKHLLYCMCNEVDTVVKKFQNGISAEDIRSAPKINTRPLTHCYDLDIEARNLRSEALSLMLV